MNFTPPRWGELKTVSDDKGPYKLATVAVDGKNLQVHLFDPCGLHTNPKKDSLIYILPAHNDDGHIFGMCMSAPADRVDQQKEGEATWTQHKRGQTVKMDDSGNILVTSSSGIVHINPM